MVHKNIVLPTIQAKYKALLPSPPPFRRIPLPTVPRELEPQECKLASEAPRVCMSPSKEWRRLEGAQVTPRAWTVGKCTLILLHV